MENKKKYYKENIKDRMFKNAANFWGVRNVENFDPLVKLIIEALASEIYKLSNEVNNIETRLLEQIARLLTPDILTTVRPGHMLLYAQPLEEKNILDKMTGFYYDNPVFKQKNKINEIGFYPVDNFQLFKCNVKSLICGRSVYTMDKTLGKEILTRSTVRSEIFSQTVWMGLHVDPAIYSLQNLSFYFDFLLAENKNGYFHLLPFTQWRHKSRIIKTVQGIHTLKNTVELGDQSLFYNYDLANMSDESIKRFYNHRFLTLKEELKVSEMKKELFPEELIPMFSEDIIYQMQEPLYWFQITFPPSFDEEIIERILIGTNVFPVTNRNLRSQISKKLKLSNIVPLNTESKEYFLSVCSVTDTQNQHYRQLPFRDEETLRYGTYSIKRGGVERFDSRDAKEYVSYLIDLLRDERAAFSVIGKGFLDDVIEHTDALILNLMQRMNEIEQNRETPSYLIIDAESKDDIVYVDYWITNCELVNDLKAGTFFAPYSDTFVEPDLVVSMTPCTGGKSRPGSSNIPDMYKFVLTGRNQVYTSEDIVNFCYCEFGDMIASVNVKKGVQVSSKPKEGLVRTIDVFVDLKKQFDVEDSEELASNIHNRLIEKSPDNYNYRIFVKPNTIEKK